MPNIKLIATDMDGTLLNSEHELPKDFFTLFEELKRKNILFVAASGRQYYNLLHVFEKIADQMAFIAENGALVMYQGQEITSATIDAKLAAQVIDIVSQIPDADMVVCGKKSSYYNGEDPEFLYNIGLYYGRKQKVDDLKEHLDDCLKIAVFCHAGTEANVYPHLQHLSDTLQVVVSGKIWLDMMPIGINKGDALTTLQKHFNIQSDQTVVFGDYMNDIEMLEQTQHSYAMLNAHPSVKKAAHFITEYSNDDDGVVKEIKKLLSSTL